MVNKSTLHAAHATVTLVLFFVAMYLFYNYELTGSPMPFVESGEVIAVFTIILVALFSIHQYLKI